MTAGDFCGEELLTWALDPNSSSNLPISTRTVETISAVEAFALISDGLMFVASQFRRLFKQQTTPAYFQVLFLAMEDMSCTFLTRSLAQIPDKEGDDGTSLFH